MYSKKTLTEKVHRLRELERQVSDLEIEIENLKDELKQDMEKRQVNELIGDDWKITWSSYESSRFDQKGFKVDHPQLFEQYRYKISSRRFSIK
jgi:predicted phage-related endonuclease